jgi:hypothetical protein
MANRTLNAVVMDGGRIVRFVAGNPALTLLNTRGITVGCVRAVVVNGHAGFASKTIAAAPGGRVNGKSGGAR